MAPVIVNRELHKGGDRSCMHVEFDITGSKIRYEAGDHVAVYPTNDPELVESLGKRLNIDLETVFSLDNVDGMFCLSYYSYVTILPMRKSDDHLNFKQRGFVCQSSIWLHNEQRFKLKHTFVSCSNNFAVESP